MFQEVKQRQGDVLLDGVSQIRGAFIHNEIDGAVAKNGHPQQGKTCRYEQNASDKFTDCPAS